MTKEFQGCLGILFAELYLPQCHSLKMKRSVISKIQQRAKNHENVSVAELEHQDKWQRTTLGFAIIGSSRPHIERGLHNIRESIELDYPDSLVRCTTNFL